MATGTVLCSLLTTGVQVLPVPFFPFPVLLLYFLLSTFDSLLAKGQPPLSSTNMLTAVAKPTMLFLLRLLLCHFLSNQRCLFLLAQIEPSGDIVNCDLIFSFNAKFPFSRGVSGQYKASFGCRTDAYCSTLSTCRPDKTTP